MCVCVNVSDYLYCYYYYLFIYLLSLCLKRINGALERLETLIKRFLAKFYLYDDYICNLFQLI